MDFSFVSCVGGLIEDTRFNNFIVTVLKMISLLLF